MPSILYAIVGPGLALAIAGIGGVLCRPKRRQRWAPAAGAVAVLAGWAALLAIEGGWRAAWSLREGPEVLIAPGLAGVAAALAGQGRLRRWATVATVLFSAWWVGQTPAARPEFWRVWAATAGLSALFAFSVRREPMRALAAGTALSAGLVLGGGPADWRYAGLVLAFGSLGAVPAGAGGAAPASAIAALVVGADLGTGRLVHGRIGLADAACAAACIGPLLVGPITTWVTGRAGRRFRAASSLAGGVLAGLLAVLIAWTAQRALIR